MSAIHYDSKIIHTFARQLYWRAALVTVTWALLGAAVGAGIVGAVHVAMDAGAPARPGAGDAALLAVLGTLLGVVVGRQRAFWLKLQAQTALCQAQIEANTRNLAYVLGAPLQSPGAPQPRVSESGNGPGTSLPAGGSA